MVNELDPSIVFDYQDLLDVWGRQVPVVERVLSAFISIQQTYLTGMERAIADRDVAAIRFQCHKIYGSASTVRACRIARVTELIRQAAIEGDYDEIENRFCLMKEAFAEFEVEVNRNFPDLND